MKHIHGMGFLYSFIDVIKNIENFFSISMYLKQPILSSRPKSAKTERLKSYITFTKIKLFQFFQI